nr:Chain B, Peptide from Alpha-synuclein [Homo sapiens]
GKTKEGVLYVG